MVVMSVFTLVLNGKILIEYLLSKRDGVNRLQYCCVLFYSMFALSVLLHAGYLSYGLRDENRSYEIIFWTGVFVYSIEFVIGVGNIFIAFDRFLAIQSPIHYCQSYSQVVLKLYVTVLPLIICVAFVACIFNRKITESGLVFGHVVDTNLVYTITLSNSFASFLAMPVSAIFLYSLCKFNKRQTLVSTDSSSVRMRRTNQIVVYQLLLEMILVVIPMTITPVLNYGFGINLPGTFGPYIPLFLAIYTAACSVLFTVKLTRNERTTRVTDARSAVA